MRVRILVDGEPHEIEVEGTPRAMTVRVDGVSYRARVSHSSAGTQVRVGTGRHTVVIRGREVLVDGRIHDVVAEPTETEQAEMSSQGRVGTGAILEVRPPMPGRVVKVRVGAGERVKRGQTLVVLEAMKMQNEIPAPEDAVVRSVSVREGESISNDRIIAVLESR